MFQYSVKKSSVIIVTNNSHKRDKTRGGTDRSNIVYRRLEMKLSVTAVEYEIRHK